MAELWPEIFFCHNSHEGAVLIYPKLYSIPYGLFLILCSTQETLASSKYILSWTKEIIFPYPKVYRIVYLYIFLSLPYCLRSFPYYYILRFWNKLSKLLSNLDIHFIIGCILISDRAERHDFWSRFLLFILLFFFPLFFRREEKMVKE